MKSRNWEHTRFLSRRPSALPSIKVVARLARLRAGGPARRKWSCTSRFASGPGISSSLIAKRDRKALFTWKGLYIDIQCPLRIKEKLMKLYARSLWRSGLKIVTVKVDWSKVKSSNPCLLLQFSTKAEQKCLKVLLSLFGRLSQSLLDHVDPFTL